MALIYVGRYLLERQANEVDWLENFSRSPVPVAQIIRTALSGEIPDRESEDAFMRRYGESRAADDPVFVGHSKIEDLDFPSSIEHTPSGYRIIDQDR